MILKIEIPLELENWNPEEYPADIITDELERFLNSGSIGRYPFVAEMLRVGIVESLSVVLDSLIVDKKGSSVTPEDRITHKIDMIGAITLEE